MPLYDWKCDRCDYKEKIFIESDERNPICIKCDKKMFVYISPFRLHFVKKLDQAHELYGLNTKGEKWK